MTTQLPPGRCLLFVYGILQPGIRPPATMSRCWPDQLRADLYDLGSYPAALRVGVTDQVCEGFVLEVAREEVEGCLDPLEEVDSGLYERIIARTECGREVWVYQFAQALPAHAVGPLRRWRPGDESQ